MRTLNVRAPAPVIDRVRMKLLYDKAFSTPYDPEIAKRWQRVDLAAYNVWMCREYGIFLAPCYMCIFTVDKETKRQRLVVSTPMLPVLITTPIMERIGREFGMGDRSKWSEVVPQSFPQHLDFTVFQET
jgi:hypothetical protein